MNRTLMYVGKKALRRDLVTGSTAVWNGPGTTQEVPLQVAARLVVHADEWLDVTNMDARARAEVVESLRSGAMPVLAETPETPVVAEDEADLEPAGVLASGEAKGDERAIIQAIESLGEPDTHPDNFTDSTGAPKLAAVRRQLGYDVSRKSVMDAWRDICEAREAVGAA